MGSSDDFDQLDSTYLFFHALLANSKMSLIMTISFFSYFSSFSYNFFPCNQPNESNDNDIAITTLN